MLRTPRLRTPNRFHHLPFNPNLNMMHKCRTRDPMLFRKVSKEHTTFWYISRNAHRCHCGAFLRDWSPHSLSHSWFTHRLTHNILSNKSSQFCVLLPQIATLTF